MNNKIKEFWDDLYKSTKTNFTHNTLAIGNRDFERFRYFNPLLKNLNGR